MRTNKGKDGTVSFLRGVGNKNNVTVAVFIWSVTGTM
jgi:hypothetical protein